MLESASPGWRLKTTHTAYPATKASGWHHRVHTTSKLILRQQAITINMTSFGFHDLLKKKVLMFRFLTDYIFCRLAKTTVLGSPSVTWLFLQSDVNLGSLCSCHLGLIIAHVWCDWQETSSYASLLYCSKLQQFTKNPKHNYACAPVKSTCCN